MINVNYTKSSDYTNLNPPQFIEVLSLLNTVLIPSNLIDNLVLPSDLVPFIINGSVIKQKAALDRGFIKLFDQDYHFFYIAPGFKKSYSQQISSIIINNKTIDLTTTFDHTYRAKLINGLLVLPNNFNHIFHKCTNGILLSDNNYYYTNILKQENKLNYFQGNTNNTIIYILHNNNIDILYAINDINNFIFLRPLYNPNYELGSFNISIEGVNNIGLQINNNIHYIGSSATVGYLPHGTYNIVLLDNNKPLNIDYLNGIIWNKNNFDIVIDKVSNSTDDKGSSLLEFVHQPDPIEGKCNLLINLYPYDTAFEITGPNNFKKGFTSGYQLIAHIEPGEYFIHYNNTQHQILAIPNTQSYYSNLK